MRGVLYGFATLLIAGCITLAPLETPAPPTPDPTSTQASVAPAEVDEPTATTTQSSTGRPTDPPTSKPTAQPTAQPTVSTEGACGDDTHNLAEYKWTGQFWWYFQEFTTPDYLDSGVVLDVLKRSVENIVTARNDCGLPDRVAATASFVGVAVESPCVEDGDYGKNVIGFGPLPDDIEDTSLAVTCPFFDTVTDEYVEADILINEEIDWALTEDECIFEELLEPTVTHEVGHAFGLAHVNERQHGDLTMSTDSNGACSTEETTLGLGDILGLEELYPLP